MCLAENNIHVLSYLKIAKLKLAAYMYFTAPDKLYNIVAWIEKLNLWVNFKG